MKKIFFILFISVIVVSCKKEDGTLNGVVTYKYNDYVGYKPDVGAKIYITKFDCDSINMALEALMEKEFFNVLKVRIEELKELETYTGQLDVSSVMASQLQYLEDSKKGLDEYAKDSLDFEAKIDRAGQQYIEMISQHLVGTTSVDGSGKYLINLQPGDYNVIAVSKSTNNMNLLEIYGRISIGKVTIKSKEISNIDFEF